MIKKSLSRRDRGRLAEAIVEGLYRDPCDEVLAVVREHVNQRYPAAGDAMSLQIQLANVNTHKWMDVIPPNFPPDIGWRPDCVLSAKWWLDFRRDEPRDDMFWEQNPSPRNFEWHGLREPRLRCTFTVYYPIEVKSGSKKTLTENQALAIPEVVKHVDHVHPLIAEVELNELPNAYSILVEEFSTSDWWPSDGISGRYRS